MELIRSSVFFVVFTASISIIILTVCIYKGLKNGFIKTLLSFFGGVISLALSLLLSKYVLEFTKRNYQTLYVRFPYYIIILMIVVGLFIIFKSICYIVNDFSKVFNKIKIVGSVNKVLGGILGVLQASLIIVFLSLILSIFNSA